LLRIKRARGGGFEKDRMKKVLGGVKREFH